MRKDTIWIAVAAALCASGLAANAQELGKSTDPVFWCDISRAQISHERDAALAQIESFKIINARLDAKIRELDAKAKQPTPERGTAPNE